VTFESIIRSADIARGLIMKALSSRVALVLILGFTGSGVAMADTLYLGDTVTATGPASGQTYTVASTGNPSNGTISPTVTYDVGNSFDESGGVTTGSDFNTNPAYGIYASSTGGPWNFQDDYYFSTTGATIQTAVISGGLSNVEDLQVRLILAAGNTPVTPTNPLLGPPPAGGTVVDSWQTFSLPGGGSFNETLPTGFAAGTYILQVRGEAEGDTAASYSGTIAFTPVPLPASIWLMLSGFGGLAALARRRRIVPV
jgi:hypothetical protein